jgi:hypothetical protein
MYLIERILVERRLRGEKEIYLYTMFMFNNMAYGDRDDL